MKTKIKRHYRSVVSVLLSVCMLISCMTVGLIATDAAQVTGDESVGWNPTNVKLHLWKSDTAYAGDTEMPTKDQHYTVNFGTLPDRSSIKFGLNAKDGTNDRWLLPDTDVNNQSVGDEKKYIWMKTNGREQAMSFDTGCDYEVWWDSTEDNGNGIQISFKKAPQNNPTKITAPSDCTATVSNGTTTITSNGSETSGSLTQNSTATVTITPPTGKKVTTATLTGGTSQTLNLISNHNGTYSATYTVPSNTTETAITFSEPVDKSTYKVNVVSSDVSEGTVAATVGASPLDPNALYREDTAITLTATEGDGFSFVEWDYKTTTDSSANPATYYVNGEDATGTTINITGEFGEHGYYIKIGTTGSYTAMTLLGNGKYISTAKVGSGNDPANKFMIKRSSDNKYANPGDDDYKFKADWISGSPVGWVGNEPNNKYFYQDNVSSGAALYVLYDPATDKISFSDDPQGHTPTTVLVKRGAVFSDGNGANISSTGTSVKNGTNVVSATVSGANKTSGFTDEWKETSNPAVSYVRQVKFTAAEVGKGAKITVATTVTDSTLKVVGFVVNGESVLGSDITVSDDTLTYTMTYTIPEYPDTKIEITPVYAKKSGTIRFYVEGVDGEIRTKWGDTVYCYAYYGSAGTTATYGLGTWPGQPLLYDNGRYFIDLAEYDGDKKINGIALNNGTWDTVHAYRILGSQTDSDKNNNQCQSYDYNDFEKINDLENEKKRDNPSYVKADIIFEMKSKGVRTPENSNFGKTFDTTGNSYPSTIDVNNFTGWEYLTDYYGNRVDVFGNIIDPTDTHYNDEPYRLVSQGYDQNSVGYFATAWVVYQKSGSTYNKLTSVGSHGYVGMDSESKFLDSGLENQAGWSALKGKPAKITYEYGVYQEKGNGGQSDDGGPKPATRYDGRWYVSKVVPVKAHTLIEYGRTEHGTFRRDYYQENNIDYTSATGYDSTKTEGLVTKTRAHFSESPNLTESKKTTAKNEDGSSVNKFNFVAEDDVEGKYTFIGWYKYNAKGEAERVSTKKNYSVDVKNEEVLIARFIKTPAGTVTITHELLTGSEGLGTTLNSVSIVESDKSTLVAAVDPNPITSSSTGAAKIDSKAITVENAFDVSNSDADRGRLVKIVLNTTPNGATFQHFHYDIDKSGSPAQLTASAPGSPFVIDEINEENATATIYIPLRYFFKEENGDKIFDEDKDTLKFYSELEVQNYSVTITKDIDNDLTTDWGDYTNFFPIKISVSHDNGTTFTQIITNLPCVDYQGNKNTNIDNCITYGTERVHAIRQGDKLTLSGLAATDQVRVEELRTNPFEDGTTANSNFNSNFAVALNNYTYKSITAQTQATPPVAVAHEGEGGTHFESFVVGTHNLDITVTNEVQMVSLDVQKLFSDFNYADESTFDFIVTYKPLGANSQSYLPLKTGTAQNSAVTATATGEDQNIYTVKKTGKIRFANIPKGSRICVNEPQSSIGVSNVTNGQRFAYDHAALASSPTSQIDNGDDFTVVADDTLTVYNKVKKNEVDITKAITIPDHSDTDTVHTIEVTVCENGNEADSVPLNQLEYKLNERYRLDESTPATVTPTPVTCVDGKATITLKAQQNLYFLYPVGSKFTVKEIDNSATNGYTLTNVTVSNAADMPAPSAQGSNPFTFYTADKMAKLTITNSKIYNYTINYTYPSRYNNLTKQKLYGDQTYTVTGSIKSSDDNFSTYIDYEHKTVRQALVKAKNPFESDFMYDFVWDLDSVVYNPNGAAYTANVTTTTPTTQNVHVTFEFPYDYTDATGTGWTGTSNIYSATSDNPEKTAYQSPAAISIGYQAVPYALEPYQYYDENDELKTGYRIHCTTAPEKCDGKDFLYWSIREKAIGSDEWVEVAKCYTNEYTYATFNNYHVRPIFDGDAEADAGEETDKSEATIKFLDTSRNQWNNNQKGTKSTSYAGQDMVYADFDVAYRYKGQDVDDSTDLKVGVLIENIGTIEPDYLLDHRNTTTAEGKTAYTNSLNHYKDTTIYSYNAEAIKTYLRSVIKNGTPAATAQTEYQTSLGELYTLNLKQRKPDQTLTNMNRVEYYHGSTVRSIAGNATDKVNEWTVNDANTSGVFRAYSYIVDADGNVTLSEPTYYTLYGTATLDHLMTE